MKVATYYNNRDIRVEERPIPSIGEGELLVKIKATSICGSDVMEWYRVSKGPRVLGHEVSGEIVEVGHGVNRYKRGERIAASHHVPCYECHYCSLGHHTLCDTLRKTNFDPGGFAEFIRLPALNVRYGVYTLGDGVSFEEGTFVEPLACTIRAQRKANVRKGQTVFVLGSGISGLLHIHLAWANGIERILTSDMNDYRLQVARDLGAHYTFRATDRVIEGLLEVNDGRLADVVVVCAASEGAIRQALQLVGRGGTVLFYALSNPEQVIPIQMHDLFWERGITLMSSYAASPEDQRESLGLIESRKVKLGKMISHRLPFDEIGRGFELVAGAQNSLKVIIDPTR